MEKTHGKDIQNRAARRGRVWPAALLACALCFAPAAGVRAETADAKLDAAEVQAAEGALGVERMQAVDTRLDYLCAWASLASYGDRVGTVAREALAADGWDIRPYRETDKRVTAKYYFLERETPLGDEPKYLLSVTGTSDLKDVQIDLSLGKVPFAGRTPTEFQLEMGRAEMKASEPLAHGGYLAYTQTAFFSRAADGGTFGETLRDRLLAEPDAKLCITGHSLGGAVAVLFGARLMAMGVPAEQIAVVTFGAPAAGNRAFVEAYGAMAVDRIVMSGDPVHTAVQSLDAGYAQFGRVGLYHRPRGWERFPHAMTGYADVALRRYFDAQMMEKRAEARVESEGAACAGDLMQAELWETGEPPRVFFAADYRLDEAIVDDLPYMQMATIDFLRRETAGLVVGTVSSSGASGVELFAEALPRAKASGCRYVLVQRYASKRLRDKREGYQIELEEALYDVNENPLAIQGFTTGTEAMTPILAALYNEAAGSESRQAALARAR